MLLWFFFFFLKSAPAVVKDSSREQCYLTHREEHICRYGATPILSRHSGDEGCSEVQCMRAGLPGPIQKPAIIPITQTTLT